MELFVVNRYEGEEPKEPKQSQNHLEQLLKIIEERKKQRAAVTEDAKPDESTENIEENTKRHKKTVRKTKKRKAPLSNATDNLADENEDKTAAVVITKSLDTETQDIDAEEAKDSQDFMVLGVPSHKKRKAVQRVLPKWLAHPEIVSADLSTGPSLTELENQLDQQLIDALKSHGINKLFPVQGSLIKWMLKCNEDRKMGWWPRDTCVSAPTGSGKTLAYVLPIIQYLQHKFVREIRCLIVLPVQELAVQVYNVMKTYSAHTNLRIGLISGATSLEAEQLNLIMKTQNGQFFSRVDIVIATPGRLVDHIEKTEGFNLGNLEFLVIDEADRSNEWLKYIPSPHRSAPALTIKNIKSLRQPPAQKLLFSATLSQDPEKLSRLGLFQPILFTSVIINDRDDDVDLDREVGQFVGKYTSPYELTERAIECSPEYKPIAVIKLFEPTKHSDKALVFTNSGEAAHRLAILLQALLTKNNIVVAELSAIMTPKQRAEMLEKFTSGQCQILVSSDALARGIDIQGVNLVISYDLPKHIKGYIHRVGRTGRAGLPGTAISVLTSNQIGLFNRMLSSAHKALPTIERIEGLDLFAEEMNYQSHLKLLKATLEAEQLQVMEKIKGAKRRRNASKRDVK